MRREGADGSAADIGEPWKTVIAHWRRCNIPIRGGVTPGAIDAFQKRYGVVLPADFAEYLRAVDGTGIDESDGEFISFLSLDEVKPVGQILDDACSDRWAYPDCYVFADYMLSSWLYAVQISMDPSAPGRVYRVAGSTSTLELEAASFREFMTRYARAPTSIL